MPNPTQPVALDQRLRTSLFDYAKNEIERGIRRQFDIISDPPAFLADNDPAPVTSQFAKTLVRQVCRAWARGRTPIQGPLADATYGAICTPYLSSIGEAPTPGKIGPDIVGGQCPVEYNLTVNFFSGGVPFGTPVNRLGVLGPLSIVKQIEGFSQATRLFAGNGVIVEQISGAASQNPTLTVSNLVRVDGLPDNCGNSPNLYLPPQTVPSLPALQPVPIGIPGLGTTPINVSFDDDGNVIIDFPELGITTIVPNPLLDSASESGATSPGEQGTAGETSAPSTDPAEGEDENRNLVGVLVNITTVPPRANAQFNQTSVFYKGAYYVYMGGDAGLTQHPASIVKTSQFYYADKGANKWRVEPNLGYALSVTPYYEN